MIAQDQPARPRFGAEINGNPESVTPPWGVELIRLAFRADRPEQSNPTPPATDGHAPALRNIEKRQTKQKLARDFCCPVLIAFATRWAELVNEDRSGPITNMENQYNIQWLAWHFLQNPGLSNLRPPRIVLDFGHPRGQFAKIFAGFDTVMAVHYRSPCPITIVCQARIGAATSGPGASSGLA